ELAHDAFAAAPTDFGEERRAIPLHVLAHADRVLAPEAGDERVKRRLPFDQRRVAEIVTVPVEEIEDVEVEVCARRLQCALQQLEAAAARGVERNDLAVEQRVLDG